MDALIQNGIDWILAIQALGTWLEVPMKFFTFLGNENFFFLVLPLIYWSLDARLGLQVAFILVTSNYVNGIIKILFAAPRPFWVSGEVQPLSAETTFGIPSGHAQNSAAIWGTLAAGVHRRWAWITAFVIAFLVGFSRLYLGVHFVQDVLVGWLLGLVLLFLFLRFWDPVAAWLRQKSLSQQVTIAFVVSLLMIALGILSMLPMSAYVFPAEWAGNALRVGPIPDPVTIEGVFTPAGILFGLAAGVAWIASKGGYDASGPPEKRALRYVLGLIGIMVFWYGLGEVFPRGETVLPLILRYLRYALVGFWIAAGAPWLFFHFKLARS
jgi:membrane-associated phospholipid phosphatase